MSEDVPFLFNKDYEQYLPNVPESELYTATYAWLTPLVEKIKTDLITMGRWDRQSVSAISVCSRVMSVLNGALTGRAARTHLRARVGMLGRVSCVAACLGAHVMAIQLSP